MPDENSRSKRIAARARKLDQDPRLLKAVERLRKLLPGDERYGDPLSTAGDRSSQAAGRQIAKLTAERPGLLREAGLSALQVWQAFAESQGRGRGDVDVTILFTDIVGFSSWALDAGDTMAVRLLRDVGEAIEPPVEANHGRVVKRLGDGMMAAFKSPEDALTAALEACANLEDVEVDGHSPQIRAGLHCGQPRQIGGDYIGVDVNVAARIAEAAGASEILVSDRALAELDRSRLTVRKRRSLFGVKGVPRDIEMFAVTRTAD